MEDDLLDLKLSVKNLNYELAENCKIIKEQEEVIVYKERNINFLVKEVNKLKEKSLLNKSDYYLSVKDFNAYFMKDYIHKIYKMIAKVSNGAKEIIDNEELKFQNTIYFSNGEKYEGEIRNDVPNGTGVLYKIQIKRIYEGEFKNGKRHGIGILYYDDNSYYVGDFKYDLRHGEGVYKNVDYQYEGQLKIDNYEGYGKLWEINRNFYEGIWENGMRRVTNKIIERTCY